MVQDAAHRDAEQDPACPKCKQTMVAGFAVDNSSYRGSAEYRKLGTWADGAMEFDWLGGLTLQRNNTFVIEGYRCLSCGFVEIFANTPRSRYNDS